MTRLPLFILFICFMTLMGCTNNSLSQLMFDDSKIELLVKYDYEYKSGKKTNTTQHIYTFIAGKITDTITTRKIVIYNAQGLLARELTYSDNKEKPNIREFEYGQNNSLTLELEINSDGDTIYLAKYISFADQNRCYYLRHITYKIVEDLNFVTAFENKARDTFLITTNYTYDGNICKYSDHFDKNGNRNSREEYFYQTGKVIKKNEYVFLNGLKMLNKTTHFDYSKNSKTPDFYTISNNDTIDFERNEFQNGELLSKTMSFEKKNIINTEYYDKGKIIRVISMNKEMNHKMINQMTYYDNGDLKEEKTYGEKINAR